MVRKDKSNVFAKSFAVACGFSFNAINVLSAISGTFTVQLQCKFSVSGAVTVQLECNFWSLFSFPSTFPSSPAFNSKGAASILLNGIVTTIKFFLTAIESRPYALTIVGTPRPERSLSLS